MSPTTVAWSMSASACLVLAIAHFFIWTRQKRDRIYLLSAVMCLAAAGSAMTELALMNAASTQQYGRLLQWQNLWVYVLLVSLVYYVHLRFGTARLWLAHFITGLWSIAIDVNFVSPSSLVYSEISAIEREGP